MHAFNDDAVIAGQGTIGLELLEQIPDLEAVVVPVGGGGLIGGIACAIKEQRPERADGGRGNGARAFDAGGSVAASSGAGAAGCRPSPTASRCGRWAR